MNNHHFDDLAQALAAGLSRRDALKLLLQGAVGGVLAWAGRGAATAQAQTTTPTYLPVLLTPPSDQCDAATSCGDRIFCNDDPRCLCVRSAEDILRCGQIPTCAARLCTTSADCADLGDGYFCDTPHSGCCTEPPADLARCIAPCTGCPQAQQCGETGCCAPEETCINRACCPAAQVCGNFCCEPDQLCENNRCVQDISADAATMASIEAARQAIAGGENLVNLSPGGTLQYQRFVGNGRLTAEIFRYRGVVASNWSYRYASTASTVPEGGTFTENYHTDFPFSRRGEFTLDESGENWELITIRHDKETRLDTERRTLTHTAGSDVTLVVVERPDDAGSFEIVEQYEALVNAVTLPPDDAGAAQVTNAYVPSPQAVCPPATCNPDAVKRLFHEAVDRGLQCLRKAGAQDFEMRLTQALYRQPLTFGCESLGQREGRDILANTIHPWIWPFPQDALIRINQDAFCNLSADQQAAVLFHEATHLDDDLRHHDPKKETANNRDDVDRSYACQTYCFNPPNQVDQCTCAKCLATDKCDGRCATSLGFQTCTDDFGATCMCEASPVAFEWFPTCAQCLASCPSGLGCAFSSSCKPDTENLCVSVTCP